MSVHVDEQYWPIVLMRCEITLTPADVETMAAAYKRIFARREPFVTITDLNSLAGVPGATERRLIAEWMKGIEGQMRASCLGSSTAMGSALLRGALTALYWLFTPPVPQHFGSALPELVAWSTEQLAKAGVPYGDAPERLLRSLSQAATRP